MLAALTRLSWWAAALPGALVALVFASHTYAQPHAFRGIHGYTGTGYDEGVYVGVALSILDGRSPYGSYDLLHPPGVPVLLLPLAALEPLLGSAGVLMAARVLTVVVMGLCCLLAARLVAHRGPVAAGVASAALAFFPSATSASQSVLLEPYLVVCTLAALVVLLPHGRLATGRRLWVGAVLLGVATSTKIWAGLVVAGLLVAVLLAPGTSLGARARRAVALGATSVGGFVAVCLPFALTGPDRFVRGVVTSQLTREEFAFNPGTREGLALLLGLDGLSGRTVPHALVVLAWGGLAVLGLALVLRRRSDVLAATTVVSLALTVPVMLRAPLLVDHYAFFGAALLAVLLGLGADAATRGARRALAPAHLIATAGVVGLAALGTLAAVVVPERLTYSRDYVADATDPREFLRESLPQDACVLTDVPTLLVLAGRLDGDRDCPRVLDPYGLWITEGTLPPPREPYNVPPGLEHHADRWEAWLARADAVVMSVDYTNFIGWTAESKQRFAERFVKSASQGALVVYLRIG